MREEVSLDQVWVPMSYVITIEVDREDAILLLIIELVARIGEAVWGRESLKHSIWN